MKNIAELRKMMELSRVKSEAYQQGYFDALADVEHQHEQPADDTAEHDHECRLKFNIDEIQAKFNDSMEIIGAMDMDKQADGDDEQGGKN